MSSTESTTKPVSASATTSGTEPLRQAITGGRTGHGLGHHQPERLWPLDWKQQSRRPGNIFWVWSHSPDLDIVAQQRLHLLGPVGLLVLVFV
jgi:hypothetical protein